MAASPRGRGSHIVTGLPETGRSAALGAMGFNHRLSFIKRCIAARAQLPPSSLCAAEALWEHRLVGALSCGSAVMWERCHVGALSCGSAVMWERRLGAIVRMRSPSV